MPRVAIAQLSLDVTQCARVLVNGEKHGARHVVDCSAGVATRRLATAATVGGFPQSTVDGKMA